MSVLFACDSLERYYFFSRLGRCSDIEIIFISTEPLVKLLSIREGFKCYLVSRIRNKPGSLVVTRESLEKSIEYLNGRVAKAQLFKFAYAIECVLKDVFKENEITFFVIWNGQHILGRISTALAKFYKVKKVYLEISNLPDKIFADPEGVNSLSSLKKGVFFRNSPPINDERHGSWIRGYIKAKEEPLPQARKKNQPIRKSINALLKLLFYGFSGKLLSYDKKLDLSEYNRFLTTTEDLSGFIFLPLQVTSDTQIKLHSKLNNIDAIRYSLELAGQRGLPLIVKLHPAETSKKTIDEILKLKRLFFFHTSNENTLALVKRARLVITINSTVGLEAKIFGKEVVVLGDAFYSAFNEEQIRKYIHGFLIDGVDYFSDKKVPRATFLEILSRAK